MTDTNAGADPTPTRNPRPEGRPETAEPASGPTDTGGSARSTERAATDRGSDRTEQQGGDGKADDRADGGSAASGGSSGDDADSTPRPARRRRRGSRGGRNRSRPASESADSAEVASTESDAPTAPPARKPQIGDARPAPPTPADAGGSGRGGRSAESASSGSGQGRGSGESSGGGRGARSGDSGGGGRQQSSGDSSGGDGDSTKSGGSRRRRRRGGRSRGGGQKSEPVTAITDADPVELDEKTLSRRRGRERKGRPLGRYLMAVHVQDQATQISVLEGKTLIEHHVSRPADEVTQIHGNIYLGRVQNVLPGMEAAFVDIGTPKNAVLYRGDTRIDPTDVDERSGDLRIEEMLQSKQAILCQVTKNPIGAKGARLTQEISLPGRFVVLVPHSGTYGISKRLPDNERKRLRQILDKVKPDGHGLIVRTAAEGISAAELAVDVERLAAQWEQIEKLAARSKAPSLLYRDPDLSIRVIREEFSQDYRQVVIDDAVVFEQVRDYVRSISPALVERIELYDPADHGGLPLFEAHHIHEQLHKALDRKVWLRSGGSLVIERTEALTVIDVNTGKNVGKSNLEETVFKNNLEAAEEVARQLRLRDIGGIIVIDFIDMEEKAHRDEVMVVFRRALARDKTRTQVFDISELGLVEMTRKRIGEGLLESLSVDCPACEGRGLVFDEDLVRS